MDHTGYSGSWITCGSYALRRAAALPNMDLVALENSTGASFGVSCAGDAWGYTRILTVFRDFNVGIDAAAPLWGIHLKRVDGVTSEAIFALLKDSHIDSVVIGPISMECLVYLPLSQQYQYADHFIACIRDSRELWRLVDSEGMPGALFTPEQIIQLLSVQNLPEARGKFTARAVLQVTPLTEALAAARIRHTLRTAHTNLKDAQESGQGPRAFAQCAELIRQAPQGRRIALLYCVDYLIQRKIMLLKLFYEAAESGIASIAPDAATEADKFIEAAGTLRRRLNDRYTGPLDSLFERMAEAECSITENWEEWVQIW